MISQIEHIGIAVKDITASIELFEKLLNINCYKTETVEREQVVTAFFQTGAEKIELVASTSPNGVIAKYIEKKGEGIHHIAFATNDILAEMKRLQEAGFILLQQEPVPGADNKMICFLHPKTTNSVLVELCMDKDLYQKT